MNFPKNFKWGAATASYQVEGGIENCDWAKASREGRVPKAGKLSDHYNKYEEDFDIAKELGHNAHRFSVEWSRIEPEEGVFDEKEIEHYKEVLRALRARNLEPFVTLWHFTLPLWFSESGGFERKDAPEIFARYCRKVTTELGSLCTNFSTMNEPVVFASNGYLRGTWPPFKRFKLMDKVSVTNLKKTHEPNPTKGLKPLFTFLKVRRNLIKSHNVAYHDIKKIKPELNISIVKHIIVFVAINKNLSLQLKAKISNWQWTYFFMNRVYKNCDSIGLNYYLYIPLGDSKIWRKTDMDWNFAPEHLYDALLMLKKYKKPIFVSEAGLADADDSDRAEYIQKQIAGMSKAMSEGIDVRGHMYWSLIDNYEWAFGIEKKFGLVEIDYKTLKRKIHPSAWEYKKLIEKYSGDTIHKKETK